MSQKKVLITGNAGFIGSWLTESLLSKGYTVFGLDNLSSGKRENLPDSKNFHFVQGDVNDASVLRDILSQNIDIVFHCASLVDVQRSISDPYLARLNILEATRNLLYYSRLFNVKKFVYSSSCAIYGDSQESPRTEQTKPKYISPYGQYKYESEILCNDYFRDNGLDTTILRYANVFGPRSTSKVYAGVINAFASRIRNNQSPQIFGDGTSTRDFVYVDDIVQANLLSAENPKSSGQIYNVGSGHPVEIRALARAISEILVNRIVDFEYLPERKGDIRHSYPDISKIKRELGYTPKYPIKMGLETYLSYLYGIEIEKNWCIKAEFS